mmetsp:Transcript_7001/g.17570  ORF Transcript_7001/g.17570 Transcript_7001/m.17570 type:complete len:157 (+) Transcript_7001:1301-1771(+)
MPTAAGGTDNVATWLGPAGSATRADGELLISAMFKSCGSLCFGHSASVHHARHAVGGGGGGGGTGVNSGPLSAQGENNTLDAVVIADSGAGPPPAAEGGEDVKEDDTPKADAEGLGLSTLRWYSSMSTAGQRMCAQMNAPAAQAHPGERQDANSGA